MVFIIIINLKKILIINFSAYFLWHSWTLKNILQFISHDTTKHRKIIWFSRTHFLATSQQTNKTLMLFMIWFGFNDIYWITIVFKRISGPFFFFSKRWLVEEEWPGGLWRERVKRCIGKLEGYWLKTWYSAGNFLQASSLKTIDFVKSSEYVRSYRLQDRVPQH